jgi:hypothetical protein
MMQTGLLLGNSARKRGLLTDKTHIHLRSASVRTYTFSPRVSLGFYQSAEQGDYTRLIYLYLLTYLNPNLRLN